ncbi:MAG: TetR/AcrR family transcriptional regulator [Cellulomonadaceae bacterium]
MTTVSSGRRALLKARHRGSIVGAATALLDERDGGSFTVDELAVRADVSRRTIFNYFDSLDEIVLAVCAETLGEIVAAFGRGVADTADAVASSGPSEPFDQVTDILRRLDLVPPMAYLTRILGGSDPAALPRVAVVLLQAFTEISARLSAQILQRHPDAEPFDVEILVGSLMSGLVAIHARWYVATHAAVDDESRQVWHGLLDLLIDRVGRGFGPSGAPRP